MHTKIIALFLCFMLFLVGCKASQPLPTPPPPTPPPPPKVLSDLAYDVNEAFGYTVYIEENGKPTPYLVLTNNYGGNVLLLRQRLLDDLVKYNDDGFYYDGRIRRADLDSYSGDGKPILDDQVYAAYVNIDEYDIHKSKRFPDNEPPILLEENVKYLGSGWFHYEGNVIDGYYDDGTPILVEKDIPYKDGYAYYNGSIIDDYLRDNFLPLIDTDLQKHIVDTEITITGGSITRDISNVEQIVRKAFLLSNTELGEEKTYSECVEGTALKYFADDYQRFIAYNSKEAGSWMLRTPVTARTDTVCGIGYEGTAYDGASYWVSGVRPAFCLPKNLPIHEGTLEG